MDKFMKAVGFGQRYSGKRKEGCEFCSAEINRKYGGERKYEWKLDIEN